MCLRASRKGRLKFHAAAALCERSPLLTLSLHSRLSPLSPCPPSQALGGLPAPSTAGDASSLTAGMRASMSATSATVPALDAASGAPSSYGQRLNQWLGQAFNSIRAGDPAGGPQGAGAGAGSGGGALPPRPSVEHGIRLRMSYMGQEALHQRQQYAGSVAGSTGAGGSTQTSHAQVHLPGMGAELSMGTMGGGDVATGGPGTGRVSMAGSVFTSRAPSGMHPTLPVAGSPFATLQAVAGGDIPTMRISVLGNESATVDRVMSAVLAAGGSQPGPGQPGSRMLSPRGPTSAVQQILSASQAGGMPGAGQGSSAGGPGGPGGGTTGGLAQGHAELLRMMRGSNQAAGQELTVTFGPGPGSLSGWSHDDQGSEADFAAAASYDQHATHNPGRSHSVGWQQDQEEEEGAQQGQVRRFRNVPGFALARQARSGVRVMTVTGGGGGSGGGTQQRPHTAGGNANSSRLGGNFQRLHAAYLDPDVFGPGGPGSPVGLAAADVGGPAGAAGTGPTSGGPNLPRPVSGTGRSPPLVTLTSTPGGPQPRQHGGSQARLLSASPGLEGAYAGAGGSGMPTGQELGFQVVGLGRGEVLQGRGVPASSPPRSVWTAAQLADAEQRAREQATGASPPGERDRDGSGGRREGAGVGPRPKSAAAAASGIGARWRPLSAANRPGGGGAGAGEGGAGGMGEGGRRGGTGSPERTSPSRLGPGGSGQAGPSLVLPLEQQLLVGGPPAHMPHNLYQPQPSQQAGAFRVRHITANPQKGVNLQQGPGGSDGRPTGVLNLGLALEPGQGPPQVPPSPQPAMLSSLTGYTMGLSVASHTWQLQPAGAPAGAQLARPGGLGEGCLPLPACLPALLAAPACLHASDHVNSLFPPCSLPPTGFACKQARTAARPPASTS